MFQIFPCLHLYIVNNIPFQFSAIHFVDQKNKTHRTLIFSRRLTKKNTAEYLAKSRCDTYQNTEEHDVNPKAPPQFCTVMFNIVSRNHLRVITSRENCKSSTREKTTALRTDAVFFFREVYRLLQITKAWASLNPRSREPQIPGSPTRGRRVLWLSLSRARIRNWWNLFGGRSGSRRCSLCKVCAWCKVLLDGGPCAVEELEIL